MSVGTSGWSYGHWHGELYPHGGPPHGRLAQYVREFSTVELNASFYRWPRREAFASWRRRLPQGFRLSVKAPRGRRADARRDYFPGRVPWWIRVAVEMRHPSWHTDDVDALLARHGAAYCVMSGAHLPCRPRVTAPFAYVRLHGPDHHHLYGGSYSDADLAWWADRMREWAASGTEVFAYFNNDGDANAVRNARTLRRMLAA